MQSQPSNPEGTVRPATQPAGPTSIPDADPVLTHSHHSTLVDRTHAVDSATQLPGSEGSSGSQPPVGETIGPYELIQKIGRGGMGVIYTARHRTLGVIRAVKMMRYDGADSEQVQRFAREVRAAAQLEHDNIVRVYDVELETSRPYYAMAYLPGGSVADHRARYQQDPQAAVALVEKIARAVQHAHERGIYHRDLKPANILIDDKGEPRVGDFGLAKILDDDIELTHTGALIGTLPYMTPEQAAGRVKEAGPSADIWALGVILYELLGGRRPFVSNVSEELRQQILRCDVPSLCAVRPALDRGLEAIVLKCLEKQPGNRYASAGALADDLARWRKGEPPSVRPDSLPMRAWRMVRKHRRLSAALLTVLVGIGAALLALHFTNPDRPLYLKQAALRRGETVPISLHGRPDWFRWVSSVGSIEPNEPGSDNPFAYSSYFSSFLELMSQVPIDRYSFRAEVCHWKNTGESFVGIYVGRRQIKNATLFWVLSFDDIVRRTVQPPPPDGADALAIVSTQLIPYRQEASVGIVQSVMHPFTRAGRKAAWRQLQIHVTPERFAFFWEGKLIGRMSRRHLEEECASLLKAYPGYENEPPGVDPRGGLGLYVYSGQAAFRNVVIEPLPPSSSD